MSTPDLDTSEHSFYNEGEGGIMDPVALVALSHTHVAEANEHLLGGDTLAALHQALAAVTVLQAAVAMLCDSQTLPNLVTLVTSQ